MKIASFAGQYIWSPSDEHMEIIFENDKLFMKFLEDTDRTELLQNGPMSFFITSGSGRSITFNLDHSTKQINNFTFSELDGKMPIKCEKVVVSKPIE